MKDNLRMVRENGLKVLVRELGTADTVIFLRQFEGGSGNYTEERQTTLTGVTIDEIVARITARNTQNA